jgi:nitrous oxidase accessory protein
MMKMILRKVFCVLVFLFFLPVLVTGKIINVTVGTPRSFQLAIQKSSPGDTLLLQPGLYKEHDIIINKRLTIIGNRYPVIDGESKNQLIVITADSVTVRGLQLQNTGRSSMTDMAGIRVQNASAALITGNTLLNNTYGIYMQNARNCELSGNTIKAIAKDELNSGNGIHAWKCDHLLIKNNLVSGHRDGIYFEFVTESSITNNHSTKNIRYGLHFMFSHNDSYSGNRFIDNGSGVAVMYSKGVMMMNNIFRHNWGDAAYAILLKEISDSRIENNSFEKNTVGLYMEGSSRIQVKRNQFIENGWALRVQASCDNNNFETNNFIGNSFDVATNGTMMLNKFNRNYWDKYDGYDMNKNGTGDVPYHPVSLYSVITEKIPVAMILYRSFLTNVMDQAEKLMPSIIPDQLKDDEPKMKKLKL